MQRDQLIERVFAGRLHLEVVKRYTAQIVHVLEYLKSLQIMHRDLKPQNIMLGENFYIKIVSALCDFKFLFSGCALTPALSLP